MDASGSTVDMYATLSIDRGSGDTELPTDLKFYTSDHKSELHKYYSFLEKNGTNKETLTIYWYWNPYIDDVEDTKYINKNFNASINVSAVQISKYAMMKNGYNYSSLTNLDLSSFNTSKVTGISSMFYGCSKLETIINIMNVNVTSYDWMLVLKLKMVNMQVL